MTWDRLQRLELELAQAQARIRQLEDEAFTLDLDHAYVCGTLNRVTTERDTARTIAVRLEQEAAHHE